MLEYLPPRTQHEVTINRYYVAVSPSASSIIFGEQHYILCLPGRSCGGEQYSS